jgi:flavodoxin
MLLLLYFSLLFFPSYQIDQSKAIIIFFSRAGENYNVGTVDVGITEMIVNYLKQVTNITSFKINPETDYPTNYQEMVTLAQNEKSSNARPSIKDPLTDISKYDTILLGYPIWHGDLPNIVMTQLEMLDFEGKTIYPFNTHEGSGLGRSISDIKNSAPKADVKDGFALRGTEARKEDSHESIRNWLSDELDVTVNQNTKSDQTGESTKSKETDESTENIPNFQNNNFIKISSVLILSALYFL